jgi:hypothetical protein
VSKPESTFPDPCGVKSSRLLDDPSSNKISVLMYKLMLQKHKLGYTNKWISKIKDILDNIGYSNIWIMQGENLNDKWLKKSLELRLKDQFIQNWSANVFESNKCLNYRIFKTKFEIEKYLTEIPFKLRKALTSFRCRSNRLPIETGVFTNIPREERICTLCNLHEVGDEYHYIFNCSCFKEQRNLYIDNHFLEHASAYKMNELFNQNGEKLVRLCKYVLVVLKRLNENSSSLFFMPQLCIISMNRNCLPGLFNHFYLAILLLTLYCTIAL